MKYLLITSLFFTFSTLNAFAVQVKLGEYALGSCRISVNAGMRRHSFDIRVEQGSQFAGITLDRRMKKVTSINGHPDSEYEFTNAYRLQMGRSTYQSTCGGTWAPVDAKSFIEIDEANGLLIRFRAKVEIARFGLPNGLSSGPIKVLTDELNCK